MRIFDCVQGTPEWLECRLGFITASQAPSFFTSKGEKPTKSVTDKAVNQIIGDKLDRILVAGYESQAMKDGREKEPQARATAELLLGVQFKEVGFIAHDDYDIGCSPDGLLGDTSGIEIKSPLKATHVGYLRSGKLPTIYVQQVQLTMHLLGVESYYWMSYYPTLPPVLLEIKKDQALLDKAWPLLVAAAETITNETEKLNELRH